MLVAFAAHIWTIVYEKFNYLDKQLNIHELETPSMTTLHLETPDNSIEFFQELKLKSESCWATKKLNPNIYGYQIQPRSKWKEGLSEQEINSFELALGMTFPEELRAYYSVMNGLDQPAINIYGMSEEPHSYSSLFYSYPQDLELIKSRINDVLAHNNLSPTDFKEKGISRIFPILGHRYLLIDDDQGRTLSIYQNDVIYWADNLSISIANEIFTEYNLPTEYHLDHQTSHTKIKFWLEH